MGRRRRWKSKGLPAPGPATHDADPVTRSIAVCGDKVAIASGRRWRVVDIKERTEVHTDTSHEGPIRGVQFSADGQYLLTCADDKTARSWSTKDWSCLRVLKAAKKASACTFSADGRHIFFSDRFGDVLTATTLPTAATTAAAAAGLNAESPAAAAVEDASPAAADSPSPAAIGGSHTAAAAAADEPSLLLGHLQAIISSLSTCESSSGQPLVISTDRDGKVRASVLPKDPTKGSYEIQSYCLGHTNFVSCAAAVPRIADGQQQQQQQLIVSGGGDGTIRLWDVDTGKHLALYVASEQPPPVPIQQQQLNGDDQQQQDHEQQQQQDDDQGSDSGSSSSDGEAAPADAATTGGHTTGGQSAEGSSKPSRPPIQRHQYAAVLNIAVSPDGKTLAAAVEGQQEIQIVKFTRNSISQGGSSGGGYALELQQKLQFSDVCNPAAVTFDGRGRLWVGGGVLRLDTESAHVGVAAQAEPGAVFTEITSEVLSNDLRAYLERRVDLEESDQATGQQIGYYHEGFKRKIYQRGEDDPKRPRTHLKEAERLRAMREAEDQKRQQGQQGQQTNGQLQQELSQK